MTIGNFVILMLFLSMGITPISVSPSNLVTRPEVAIKTRNRVRIIIDQSGICDLFASKMKSKSSLVIIKSRFPLFFDECQLRIPLTKNQSITGGCKRYGWKGRSLRC